MLNIVLTHTQLVIDDVYNNAKLGIENFQYERRKTNDNTSDTGSPPTGTLYILTLPFRAGEIAELQHIRSVQNMNYWQSLKALKVFLVERRREIYIMIYTCRVLEGLVPELYTKVILCWSAN